MSTQFEKLCSKPRSQWEEDIYQRIIGRNSQRDRRIITRRLLDGITYERLAEEFGLSTQQVKKIVQKWSNIILK